ncbi:hypothetical protein [Psychromonas sp. KJ10-2]|uniref:hypothetical protein n=1 Tax=Psychromonas sp. KJ10-2 TaxID=3391822 RepID=UPI0039B64844
MKKIILSMALLASFQAHSESLYSYYYSLEDAKGNILFESGYTKGSTGFQYKSDIGTKTFIVTRCTNNKITTSGSSLNYGSEGGIDLNKGTISITNISIDMNGYTPCRHKKCIVNSANPKQIKHSYNIDFDLSQSTEQKFQVNPGRIIKVIVKKY